MCGRLFNLIEIVLDADPSLNVCVYIMYKMYKMLSEISDSSYFKNYMLNILETWQK
jgi:hypothetical protein